MCVSKCTVAFATARRITVTLLGLWEPETRSQLYIRVAYCIAPRCLAYLTALVRYSSVVPYRNCSITRRIARELALPDRRCNLLGQDAWLG